MITKTNKNMKKLLTKLTIAGALMLPAVAFAANDSANKNADVIKMNQVGYYPQQEKVIVVEGTKVSSVTVLNEEGKKVLTAKRMAQTVSPMSKKKRSTFDVSALTQPGTYTIVAGKNKMPLIVSEDALTELGAAAIKSFYYQRTAMALTQKYAGQWSRPAGHMDTKVIVHPAAASAFRPAGTVISSSKGWYDAGDYNKYVVNSAFSMGVMLAAYELLPDYFAEQKVAIPESGNETPDLLNENMWNLEWLFTMQDYDGGAYHKLTTPNFEGFVMPSECHQQRYVTQKSTCATLDFAAIMAKCARAYNGNKDYPSVSVRCINAARAAYEWAKKNPTVYYNQDGLNKKYEPKVSTGTYGDGNATDEFYWAAVELYLTTGDAQYLNDAKKYAPKAFATPSWATVSSLGTFALITAKNLNAEASQLKDQQVGFLKAYAEKAHVADVAKTSFYSPYGNSPRDFFWGCNSEGCGVQGVSLIFAYKLTGNEEYKKDVFRNIDYLLGRNATGYCYVTGFGEKPSVHPHHRLSDADGIEAPVPGLLVGGPNPGKQDGVEYTSLVPDEAYMDVTPSYASNEIAINWSATLVALINGAIAIR